VNVAAKEAQNVDVEAVKVYVEANKVSHMCSTIKNKVKFFI